jgi:very-short-patch-repair endonuclease
VWNPVQVRGSRDERVAAIADHQRGRLSRSQLLAVGITRSMIETTLDNGRLSPRHPGVYVLAGTGDVEFARETEALLACPWGTALSHHSAPPLWHLPLDASPTVHVTLPVGAKRRLPGVRAHRTATIDPKKDLRIRHGLPVTSAERLFVDIAGDTPEAQLERLLDDALRRDIVRLPRLKDTIARAGPTRKGAKLLRALIADRERGRGLSRSDTELRLKAHLRQAGIPEPHLNVRFDTYIPDMVWWEQRVIVEVDSWEWHGSRHKFEDDRQRDATLTAHGWTILRFTARQIKEQPMRVVAQIAAALAHGEARRIAARTQP